MKKYFKQVLPKIEAEVGKVFPARFSEKWHKDTIGDYQFEMDPLAWENSLARPFFDLFKRGGKRLRPILTCHALGGRGGEIYSFSVIPEMIHNGTLIVDDVEDRSELRRGKPSVHKIYGASIAINAGNFVYFLPLSVIEKSKISDKKKLQMYSAVSTFMTHVHIGQGLDIWWSEKKDYKANMDQYLQMNVYKTGSLLGAGLEIGAILAEAKPSVIKRLRKLAQSMSLAFQVQDDILNLKPTKSWGKETGEDITEGKFTYMVAHTLSKANRNDKVGLKRILASGTKKKTEIEKAISLMDKYKALKKARGFVRKQIDISHEIAGKTFSDNRYTTIIHEVLDFLSTREK